MRFFLGLGSNLGDRAALLRRAADALAIRGVYVVRASSVYETDPVGGPPGQPRYLNQVVEVETALGARGLLDIIQDIERSLGRNHSREARWGPRLLDIDILIGDETVNDPDLVVPHPRLGERAFVLVPLSEIAPTLSVESQRVVDLLARVSAVGVRRVD